MLNYETSRLVRRFFIYDSISGIDTKNGYKNQLPPSVVRLATDVKLTVMLDPNNEEQIYTPLLTLSYKEKAANLITDSSTFSMSYFMDYFEEASAFWEGAFIAFICF